ncbi:MAG: WD40 repeat domain-containing protein [Lewinellaceae bacterium]|nr:WD40 repeat domain-containing protein [Lewinellaceae bacterium]
MAVAFSPKTASDPDGGQFILSGSSDHKAILWDKFGKRIAEFSEPAEKGEVTSVAFSPDGTELLLGLKDGSARLLDKLCKEIRRFQHKDEIASVAFSPDGIHILTACKDKTAALWNRTNNTRPQQIFTGHSAPVLCAVFSKSGDTLLTGSADGTAILWKSTGGKIRSFQHSGQIQSVAIATDGQKFATGSSDGTLKIWGLADNEVKSVKRFSRGLSSLKFSIDNQYIVLSSDANPAAQMLQLAGKLSLELKGLYQCDHRHGDLS